MIKPLTVSSILSSKVLNKDYKGFYNGQFNLDVSIQLLRKEFIRDVRKWFKSGVYGGWFVSEKGETIDFCLYHYLDWDSRHFGFPMEQLEYFAVSSKSVSDRLLETYITDAKKRGIKHISTHISAAELVLLKSLIGKGFECLACKAMLRYGLSNTKIKFVKTEVKMRPFRCSDMAVLLNIVSDAIEFNRFSSDIYLEQKLVPAVYQSWLANLISSQSDNILVTEYNRNICGFVAFSVGIKSYDKSRIGDFKPGFIDLVVVKKDYRGKNIGTFLLQNAIRILVKLGCRAIYANTAMQNIGGLMAFQRAGFKVFSSIVEIRVVL